MSRYTLTHLTDSTLLRELKTLVSQERSATALLIAHLAEVDARRLYAPAGYPSLFNYCVEELHFSEESACRRIRAARVAREHPAVFDMLADGRLHLTAVDLLAPRLTPENAGELLAAAVHKSRAGIERLLAERFPQPDLPTLITPVAPQPSPGTIALPAPANNFPSPATVMHKVAPLAPQRFAVQFTMDQEAHDDLLYAQALLGHSVPNGDPAQVIARALKTLVAHLEKQKFAKTDRPAALPAQRARPPGPGRREAHGLGARRRPVHVRGRDRGHRCEARTRLEFDHGACTGGRTSGSCAAGRKPVHAEQALGGRRRPDRLGLHRAAGRAVLPHRLARDPASPRWPASSPPSRSA